MDLVTFFRMAIPITLAVICGGVIVALNVVFFGNAFFVLKNSFKRGVKIAVVKSEQSKDKALSTLEPKQLDKTIPKAS